MGEYDKSSKWLIQHHGDAILRLAGINNLVRWNPRQAELVQPTQLPDGLIEAQLEGETEPDLFLIEIATYPERRVVEQVQRNLALTWLDRHLVPEVLVLVLCPRGVYRIPASHALQSRRGWASWQTGWKVVELWELPAATLLAAGDPGLVPWVATAKIDGPPEPVFEECRRVIEQTAAPDERSTLFAVTQILARLRYNDPNLISMLGGRDFMIESPLIDELRAEERQDDILRFLTVRFGPIPADIRIPLKELYNLDRLGGLIEAAALAQDLDAFRSKLQEC